MRARWGRRRRMAALDFPSLVLAALIAGPLALCPIPDWAGEIKTLLSVSATVIGSASVDAALASSSSSAEADAAKKPDRCAAVRVSCDTETPLRVSADGAGGGPESTALVCRAPAEAEPAPRTDTVRSCATTPEPAAGGLAILVEY